MWMIRGITGEVKAIQKIILEAASFEVILNKEPRHVVRGVWHTMHVRKHMFPFVARHCARSQTHSINKLDMCVHLKKLLLGRKTIK